MSSNNQFTSASRYIPNQKNKAKNFSPIFTGVVFLLVGIKYLSFSIKALSNGENFYFISSLIIFAGFVISFLFLRKGITAQKQYEFSKYAKAPKVPYKTIAAVILSGVSSFSAFLGGYSLITSILLFASMLIGWYLYYGFDPFEDKLDGYDNDKAASRIMKLLIQANQDISTIKDLAIKTRNIEVKNSMNNMANSFSKIVEHIQNEPDDYDKARKYLVSYLGELTNMSSTYIKLESQNKANSMTDSFLDTLQSSIEKLNQQYEKLMDDDLIDLDVKLSVMKKRLKNED
jgi:5-bromo-4-chloroindolyl phosphate hydrolysis protein